LPNATDIKRGKILVIDGELWKVLDAQHITPGNWRGYVQATMRSLRSGSKDNRRFRSTDKVEFAFIETRELQYLYKDGNLHHFMDTESYEQSAIDEELLGDALSYMKESDTVNVEMHDGQPVGVVLPNTVELVVTETGPGTRGDTVSNVFKDATVETGLVIKVPLFVETGELVRVDTRTGAFVERVS